MPLSFWIGFHIFVAGMLVVDLVVVQRRHRAMKFREALLWSAIWVVLAAAFAAFIYTQRGHQAALEFTTGYLVELALSVDNLFVFLLIFRYFQVPAGSQRSVLFWGILGALVMRGIFISAGVALIQRFHFLIYIFGAFLVFIGMRLFREEEKEIEPEKNFVLRLVRKLLPVTKEFHGERFLVRKSAGHRGGLYATPLLITLIMVETTDVIFATDSIPAILAITRDGFIVYTSNVFAILGLRAMYFALAGLMDAFHYLNYGLAVVLMFIGAKMLASGYYEIPTLWALVVVVSVLGIAIGASLMFPKKKVA